MKRSVTFLFLLLSIFVGVRCTSAVTPLSLPVMQPTATLSSTEPRATNSPALITTPTSMPTPTSTNLSSFPISKTLQLIDQIGGKSNDIAIQGTYAYLGIGPRLVIFDISNPAQPIKVGQTDVLNGIVQSISVVKNLAYITTSNKFDSGGLYIIDVSKPDAKPDVWYRRN